MRAPRPDQADQVRGCIDLLADLPADALAELDTLGPGEAFVAFRQRAPGYPGGMRERSTEREPAAAADVVARMLDRPGLRRLEEVARRANGDRRRRRLSGEGVLPNAEPGTAGTG